MSKAPDKDYDSGWQEKYRESIATPDEAVSHIQPGQRVFIGTGCGQPMELVKALGKRSMKLVDTEIVQLLTLTKPHCDTGLVAEHCRLNSFYVAGSFRKSATERFSDYTPVFLSEIPYILKSGKMPLDAVLIQVTPPDERGMCSLGISVDVTKTAVENSALVIAEVNPQMPRTLGDTSVDILDVDILVPVDNPIAELGLPELDDYARKIGVHVAALIDEGSTIELGIGRIPYAIALALKNKRNLGVHAQILTDAVADLVRNGVVTGMRKSIDQGKVVASYCLGTKKTYDFIHQNPLFSFHSTEYVNSSSVISQQHKMVSVVVGVEVDLTGQVCTDSMERGYFSGVGGQSDFCRAAARSLGGKSIVALPSTTGDSRLSRIVTHLSTGSGVVITRGDVHYVVTEYGTAYLFGKSVQERALALISIAHPEYREGLLKDAIKEGYVREELGRISDKISEGLPELRTSLLLGDGTLINFRSIHPTDEPRMRDLFYKLSQQTLYYRFMSRLNVVPRRQIQDFTYIDHRSEVAIIGTVPESHGEEIIAIGRYFLDSSSNRAELAFVVRDKWQNRGIGTYLCKHLANIARGNGIKGFSAEVLRQNKAMQTVLNNSGLNIASKPKDDIISIKIDFD